MLPAIPLSMLYASTVREVPSRLSAVLLAGTREECVIGVRGIMLSCLRVIRPCRTFDVEEANIPCS